MAMTQSDLELGKIGIKKVFVNQSEKFPLILDSVIGRKIDTKEQYEYFKSLIPFGPAEQTPEGTEVPFDDMAPLFTQKFTPYKVAKGVEVSWETKLTDQYGIIANLQKYMAKSFAQRKNQAIANLNNNGFSDTTSGMNNEVLYSTAHSLALSTGSNRPAVDIGFGPLAVEQCLQELRAQKDARGMPMPTMEKVLITVPIGLEGLATRVLHSDKMATTNNNDINFLKERVSFDVINWYTSSTAWFARGAAEDDHGLFLLQQANYEVEQLPKQKNMMIPWIGWEIYCVGWYDWHGTWGTVGQ